MHRFRRAKGSEKDFVKIVYSKTTTAHARRRRYSRAVTAISTGAKIAADTATRIRVTKLW